MRLAAYALLVAGTVLGTLGGARVPQADWVYAGTGVALLLVAIALLRLDTRRELAAQPARADGAPADALARARAQIGELASRLEAVVAEADALPLAALRDRLTELDRDFLRPLGDEVPSLLPKLGPAAFAHALGVYAAGERLVHRAWSAATDGHRPEALASLAIGAARIREARDAL